VKYLCVYFFAFLFFSLFLHLCDGLGNAIFASMREHEGCYLAGYDGHFFTLFPVFSVASLAKSHW